MISDASFEAAEAVPHLLTVVFLFSRADMMHWGGGNLAQLLRDKARDLGREYDEQFRKRQQEFFDAAVRNPDLSAGDFHEYSWQDSWKGVEDMKGKKKDKKKDKSKKK